MLYILRWGRAQSKLFLPESTLKTSRDPQDSQDRSQCSGKLLETRAADVSESGERVHGEGRDATWAAHRPLENSMAACSNLRQSLKNREQGPFFPERQRTR